MKVKNFYLFCLLTVEGGKAGYLKLKSIEAPSKTNHITDPTIRVEAIGVDSTSTDDVEKQLISSVPKRDETGKNPLFYKKMKNGYKIIKTEAKKVKKDIIKSKIFTKTLHKLQKIMSNFTSESKDVTELNEKIGAFEKVRTNLKKKTEEYENKKEQKRKEKYFKLINQQDINIQTPEEKKKGMENKQLEWYKINGNTVYEDKKGVSNKLENNWCNNELKLINKNQKKEDERSDQMQDDFIDLKPNEQHKASKLREYGNENQQCYITTGNANVIKDTLEHTTEIQIDEHKDNVSKQTSSDDKFMADDRINNDDQRIYSDEEAEYLLVQEYYKQLDILNCIIKAYDRIKQHSVAVENPSTLRENDINKHETNQYVASTLSFEDKNGDVTEPVQLIRNNTAQITHIDTNKDKLKYTFEKEDNVANRYDTTDNSTNKYNDKLSIGYYEENKWSIVDNSRLKVNGFTSDYNEREKYEKNSTEEIDDITNDSEDYKEGLPNYTLNQDIANQIIKSLTNEITPKKEKLTIFGKIRVFIHSIGQGFKKICSWPKRIWNYFKNQLNFVLQRVNNNK